MVQEYWMLNRLRRSRHQTWFEFCAEFIPYGLSSTTVYRAATGRGVPYETTRDKLDRYVRDHQEEINKVEVSWVEPCGEGTDDARR